MDFTNISQPELSKCFDNIEKYLQKNYALFSEKYLDLGVKTVRILCYSAEFMPHLERQLTYVLKDSAQKYDATLVIWKDENIDKFAAQVSDTFSPVKNFRLRLDVLYSKNKKMRIRACSRDTIIGEPEIRIDPIAEIIEAKNLETNTYYYSVKNLEPEEFIRQGHIFIHALNNILRTENTNIVHGAAVGLDNKGILFCARGQRGKSTLSVLSMMQGFEYVSDDYLTLEKINDKIYTYPIYSIITLSPRMWSELYDRMKGRFVSNNARKDKYVINIEAYHDSFKTKYPIELCMFPEIVSDENPSIVPCIKGRSITQLVHSTVAQTRDINNQQCIRKLIDMVKNYEFFQINLCNDIDKNTKCLHDFIKIYKSGNAPTLPESSMYIDITFDYATILDSDNAIIYQLNKFATDIYENLKKGVNINSIKDFLKSYDNLSETINEEVDLLFKLLQDMNILLDYKDLGTETSLNSVFFDESKGFVRLHAYKESGTVDLLDEVRNK